MTTDEIAVATHGSVARPDEGAVTPDDTAVVSDAYFDSIDLEDELLLRLHARFCTVFANSKRLGILGFLTDGEKRVSEIAAHLGISQPNVSQHLRLMRDRGVLCSRREGNSVLYRVASPKFLDGARLIREGLVEVMTPPERERIAERRDS